MDTNLKFWIENSCMAVKAKTILDTMELLLLASGTDQEQVWLMYLSKVGIADNQATFDNLQQVILDSTIVALEQYSLQINEDVGFADQSALTMLLRALMDLGETELVNEVRTVLNTDLSDLDKLLGLIEIVAVDATVDVSSYIEYLSPSLLERINEIYSRETAEVEISAAPIGADKVINYAVTLDGDDEILDFAKNLVTVQYSFNQLLSVFSGRLLELEDPFLFTTRLILLYMASVEREGDSIERHLSHLISTHAIDGPFELECLRILAAELRKF